MPLLRSDPLAQGKEVGSGARMRFDAKVTIRWSGIWVKLREDVVVGNSRALFRSPPILLENTIGPCKHTLVHALCTPIMIGCRMAGDPLKGLREYDDESLARRSPALPKIYVFEGLHPQRPVHDSDSAGRTFVILVDVSVEGKARELRNAENLDIPTGREADMLPLYGRFLFPIKLCNYG